ncbi:MAG: hypothetical protein AAF501_21100, partial [Pseudomonadota bacterium]
MPRKSKAFSIATLIAAQIGVLALWFSSVAVLAEMGAEAGLSPPHLAWLSTAVQIGFAFGALGFAILGISDRFDPRRVFTVSAISMMSASRISVGAAVDVNAMSHSTRASVSASIERTSAPIRAASS